MAIWKTKWGWRAEFEFRGERIIAKGFFKYKEEAREWVKNKKKTLKELLGRSSSLGRRDITFWFLAQR